jgi:hypothetical protein
VQRVTCQWNQKVTVTSRETSEAHPEDQEAVDPLAPTRVVILGVRLLVNRSCHSAGRELGVLYIFCDYSLKYLKYTRICLNILKYFLVGRAHRSTG